MSTDFAPTAIQHINLVVPRGTLHLAREFYSEVVGFGLDPVPTLMKDALLWLRVGDCGQQIHVAFEGNPAYPSPRPISSAHPCFTLPSKEALLRLQTRIWESKVSEKESRASECDEPGLENSGSKGPEYPSRFFARDYAGNKLEFSFPNHID